jgi:hypothetical protein
VTKYKLIIEVRDDDKVYVTGPLDNKTLCLAMLEEAKETVKNFQRTQIVIPSPKDLLNGNNLQKSG